MQTEALKKLIFAVCTYYRIPFTTPNKKEYIPNVKNGTFHGVVGHYHVSKNKWDPFGLDIKKILPWKEAEEEILIFEGDL